MLGAFLCMPAMVTLMETNFAVSDTIFGLPVVKMAFTIGESTKVFGYTESVIPIILAVIVLKWLEKGLTKLIPEMLQIILVPGLSLIIMLPVILTVVGPVGAYIGYGMQWLYSTVMGFSPLVGGALVGALWGVFVIFGAHRALLPVGLNDVAVTASVHSCGSGHNTLMCYAGAANFSQAGAALRRFAAEGSPSEKGAVTWHTNSPKASGGARLPPPSRSRAAGTRAARA